MVGDLSTWGNKLGAESCLVTEKLLVITVATAETRGIPAFPAVSGVFQLHCAGEGENTLPGPSKGSGWRLDPHPEWAKRAGCLGPPVRPGKGDEPTWPPS